MQSYYSCWATTTAHTKKGTHNATTQRNLASEHGAALRRSQLLPLLAEQHLLLNAQVVGAFSCIVACTHVAMHARQPV